MPNYKQAPKLYHNKSDFNCQNFYNLPQELMDCVFQQLDGKCGNQIKLITVLLGTLGNGSFGVSEKWICDRTGMVQQTYNTARKALVERGWIYLEEGKIYVLPQIIKWGFKYPDGATDKEKLQIKIDTISRCVNAVKKQSPNDGKAQDDMVPKAQFEIVPKAQYDIVYNKININNSNKNNIGVDDLSPDGANSSTQDVKIEGEITLTTANNIIEKEWISDTLLFIPSSGKYFRVRG